MAEMSIPALPQVGSAKVAGKMIRNKYNDLLAADLRKQFSDAQDSRRTKNKIEVF
ncbi:MAG: hypothetical protein J6O04_12825 [Selenomonadaceae bacterium]|nr:hypothetical protein [Selenomonadaceae bacterium]